MFVYNGADLEAYCMCRQLTGAFVINACNETQWSWFLINKTAMNEGRLRESDSVSAQHRGVNRLASPTIANMEYRPLCATGRGKKEKGERN